MCWSSGVPRRGLWVQTPPPKFRRPSKIVSNSTRLWKLLKIAEFRTSTPQDVRKKGSKILKLPSVRNCFTLAMTNKLVVIINNLKVPKINKILLYEMKFLVPNYSCLQKPWLGNYSPQIPVLSDLCPQLNLLKPHPHPNKIPGYATVLIVHQESVADTNCDIELCIYPTSYHSFPTCLYFINNHIWAHKLTSSVQEVPGAFVCPADATPGHRGNELRFVHTNSITLIVRPSHIRAYIPCIHTSLVSVSSFAVVCGFVFPDEPRVLYDPVRDSN